MMKVPLILWSFFLTAEAFVSKGPNPRPLTLTWSSPKPLESQGDWTAYLDEENTGLVYYFNGKTGEALWEPPTPDFPVVVLSADLRREAESKRQEYIAKTKREERRAQKQQQDADAELEEEVTEEVKVEEISSPEEEDRKGLMDILFGEPEEAVVKEVKTEDPPMEKVQEEQENWLGGIFGTQDTVTVKEEKVEPEKPKEEENWFGGILAAYETDSVEAEKATEETQKQDEDGGVFGNILSGLRPTVTEAPREIEVATPVQQKIKIEMGSCVLPHPSKILWGGEDAVFTQGRTFGVFDGVSGANKLDGMPLYSKTMAQQMKKKIAQEASESVRMDAIIRIMAEAAEYCDKKSTGATTAICGSISEDGFLRVLNLGDSACVVVRKGKIASRTREISHYFDCPYQLSTDSPDRPRDGTRLNLELVPGDLVIMGSDGVFDNLSDQEVLKVIGDGLDKPNVYAKQLSDRSRKVSFNRKAETPYAKLAKRSGDPDYEDGLGGKVDDVCCVVARYI